jgi:MFS family permease
MLSRFVMMLTLVLAGEIVFLLPFNMTRFFRPTLLEAFELTNTQLGDVFAVYGIFAMLAYFPGGALADRFSARSLLTASVIATAAGGVITPRAGRSAFSKAVAARSSPCSLHWQWRCLLFFYRRTSVN